MDIGYDHWITKAHHKIGINAIVSEFSQLFLDSSFFP